MESWALKKKSGTLGTFCLGSSVLVSNNAFGCGVGKKKKKIDLSASMGPLDALLKTKAFGCLTGTGEMDTAFGCCCQRGKVAFGCPATLSLWVL